jgi:putative transposase
VRKTYQNEEIDTNRSTVPKAVSVALAELADEVQEGLLALAVGAGLQVLTALMEDDVIVRCGVKGRQDPTRTATGHGHGAGSVTLGGRRIPVARPLVITDRDLRHTTHPSRLVFRAIPSVRRGLPA